MNLIQHATGLLLVLMAVDTNIVRSLTEASKCETCKQIVQRFKEVITRNVIVFYYLADFNDSSVSEYLISLLQ
jgi:hypothetical protein